MPGYESVEERAAGPLREVGGWYEGSGGGKVESGEGVDEGPLREGGVGQLVMVEDVAERLDFHAENERGCRKYGGGEGEVVRSPMVGREVGLLVLVEDGVVPNPGTHVVDQGREPKPKTGGSRPGHTYRGTTPSSEPGILSGGANIELKEWVGAKVEPSKVGGEMTESWCMKLLAGEL